MPEAAAIPVSAPLPGPGAGLVDNQSQSASSDFDSYFNEATPAPVPDPPRVEKVPGERPATPPVKEVPIRPESVGSKIKDEIKPDAAKPDKGAADGSDKTKPDGSPEAKAGQADKKPRETPWQIIHRLEKERDDYKRQIEARPQTNGEHPEVKTLKETLAERDKRLSDMETKLRYADYSQSDDYKQTYEAPFVDAWIAGQSKTASLSVVTGEGTTRKGTKDDFDTIMGIGSDDQAADAAVEMFGAKAPLVLYHREEVMKLNAAKTKALDKYRTEGSERQKVSQKQQEDRNKEISGQIEGLWKKHVTDPREKYSAYAKPVEGDEAGNKLLERGYKLAEEAFANLNPFDPSLTPQQRDRAVALHGMAINKSAWFDRLADQHKGLQAQVKELEAKLKEFESTEPGPGSGKRGKEKAGEEGWESLLETKYAR